MLANSDISAKFSWPWMSVSVAEFVLYWLRQRDAPSHRDDRRHLHKYSLWYSLRVSAVSSEDGAGSGVRGAWLSPDGCCDITPVCHNTDFVVAAVLLSSTSRCSTGSRHTIRPAWLYLAVHSPVIMTGDWWPLTCGGHVMQVITSLSPCNACQHVNPRPAIPHCRPAGLAKVRADWISSPQKRKKTLKDYFSTDCVKTTEKVRRDKNKPENLDLSLDKFPTI